MGDGWVGGDFADAAARGDVDSELIDAAGKIDDLETVRLLKVIEHYWPADEETPPEEWDGYNLISGISKSESVQRAVSYGNATMLRRYTGSRSTAKDIGVYRAIEQVESMFTDYPVTQLYLYGDQGAGKTDFTLLNVEVFRRIYGHYKDRTVEVATNIQTASRENDFIDFVDSYDDLLEWLGAEDVETVEDPSEELNYWDWLDSEWTPSQEPKNVERLVIIDEGSQNLTGFGGDISRGQAVATLVKLFRKYSANVIIIGHTGRDLTRDLRRLMLMCRKVSKKKVRYGYQCDSEGKIQDEIDTITGVPPTELDYDTEESSSWTMDFGDDEDEEDSEAELQEVLYRIYENNPDLSYRDIAEEVDRSKDWVRRRVVAHRESVEGE